jgi:heme A synthase
MNRQHALKIINPLLALLVVIQLATGLFGGSLSYETFELLHKGGAIVLTLVVLTHVSLNFNWIKAQYLGKQPHGKV